MCLPLFLRLLSTPNAVLNSMARRIGDDGWVEVEVDGSRILKDIAECDATAWFDPEGNGTLATGQVAGAVRKVDIVEGEAQ